MKHKRKKRYFIYLDILARNIAIIAIATLLLIGLVKYFTLKAEGEKRGEAIANAWAVYLENTGAPCTQYEYQYFLNNIYQSE